MYGEHQLNRPLTIFEHRVPATGVSLVKGVKEGFVLDENGRTVDEIPFLSEGMYPRSYRGSDR